MINSAHLVGRVGKIDSKVLNSGNKVSNISMVTSKKYTKDGEKIEKVTWHNIKAFNKLADIAQSYVNVGDLLYICGELDSQKYTGKDGIERTSYFIIAHNLTIMPRGKEHKAEPKAKTNHKDFSESDFPDDSIPF